MIQKSDFFGYDSYTISSERLSVRVMTLGATVIDFRFDGRPVALRFETAQEYLDSDAYLGAIVGRYANRIGGAHFTLNGKTYELPANEGKNQLHGGKNSYDRRIWDAEVCGDSAVRFRLFSPDGDNGYPGNLSIAVTYTVAGDRMRIDFEGDCDADTYFAPTTHLYFNLGGAPTVLDTRLWINGTTVLPVDAALLPCGAPVKSAGLLDFSQGKAIEGCVDHCFPLDGECACRASAGGVEMELHTDFPALQVYSGEFLKEKHSGVALEPEFYPDSPNHPEFPSSLLRKGEHFHKYAEYRFRNV